MRFGGVDWGNSEHRACLVDEAGNVLEERAFAHKPAGLVELVEWLTKGGALGGVAIETPHGPVVEAMLERGIEVWTLNPKQLDRFRDRFAASGAKDDRRDARVLAESLRTDRRAFRQVRLDEPWVREIRELSRLEHELVVERVALANGLREQLRRYYPQVLALSEDVDEPWMLALYELAPTPAAARSLTRAKLVNLLKEHRIRRLDADLARSTLREPGFRVAPATVAAASMHATSIHRRLVLTCDELRLCRKRIAAALDAATEPAPEQGDEPSGQKREQRDVTILASLPGVGRTVLATLLAEAWSLLQARDYQALRTWSGVAPVTKRSGKQLLVVRRLAINPRLADALFHWARIAAQRDATMKAKYQALRGKGHSQGRTLRAIGDRLLGILVAMLRSGSAFDPARPKKLAA